MKPCGVEHTLHLREQFGCVLRLVDHRAFSGGWFGGHEHLVDGPLDRSGLVHPGLLGQALDLATHLHDPATQPIRVDALVQVLLVAPACAAS